MRWSPRRAEGDRAPPPAFVHNQKSAVMVKIIERGAPIHAALPEIPPR
jgi:hypothetical protein